MNALQHAGRVHAALLRLVARASATVGVATGLAQTFTPLGVRSRSASARRAAASATHQVRAHRRRADVCRPSAGPAHRPGAIVETRTFSRPGDYYAEGWGPWPGEVGPFYIEGATPDDTLVVRIVRLRPNRDTAVSAVNPAASAPWPVTRARGCSTIRCPRAASSGVSIAPATSASSTCRTRRRSRSRCRCKPMLGRVAVAPGRRRGVRRSVARQLRRQHGRRRRARGHDGLPADLPRGRVLLLRRRARPAGRRRDLRLGPRDDDGRDVAVRSDQGPPDPAGRESRTPTTSWWPAARGRSSTRSASRRSS